MTEEHQPSLVADHVVEFPFQRTVGPVVGAFLGGLRDQQLSGVRAPDGTVLCPALEFAPGLGTPVSEQVPLAATGTVVSWTWVPARPGDPVETDFAWALVNIDGAQGALFHAVDCGGDPGRIATGMRVRARWADERTGTIRDLACFEPEEGL
jgi:uncharacterized OB-fold protein